MEPIKCKNCPEEIEPLPSGTWVTHEGFCYCKKRVGDEAPMLHEPLLPVEWLVDIKTLGANATVWSPYRIARIMQLPEKTIKDILGT